MDTQGRLTPGDGQRYLDFCEKWGETPQGEKLKSCPGCGRCIGHSDHCTGPGLRGESLEQEVWRKFKQIVER